MRRQLRKVLGDAGIEGLGVPLSTLHREVIRLDESTLILSRTQGRNRLIRANLDRPAARADLYEAADRASARLDIEANPVVRTTKQWAEPADALVSQINDSPHVTVLDSRELVDS